MVGRDPVPRVIMRPPTTTMTAMASLPSNSRIPEVFFTEL